MKRHTILRIALWTIASLMTVGVGFFAAAWIGEYRPAPRERIDPSVGALVDNRFSLPDTLTLLSWNIGYAGLGDNMDFFYDGGHRVRDSRERTQRNLRAIIATLRLIQPDIILLQEVDRHARRTYGIDEVAALRTALPEYTAAYACNYRVGWVPIPLRNPIGHVDAGLLTLSRIRPTDCERIDYPSRFGFPMRLFNLRRCMLSASFITRSGDTIRINNTHNTAFDTGGMRTAEMHFAARLLDSLHRKGIRTVTGGDWNQYPPAYTPSTAELSNPNFAPQAVGQTLFGSMQWASDTIHSLRYLNHPYTHDSRTTKSLTDFFVLSEGVRLLSINTLPLDFRWSDHNPVLIRIILDHSTGLE